MDTTKKILTQIFVALGIIFLILIIGAGYMFVADPLGMKLNSIGEKSYSTQSTNDSADTSSGTNNSGAQAESTGFTLTASQKSTLQTFGIDPNSLPSTLSAEQVACFEARLGVSRVAEIKAGASPGMAEFFKARSCI